MGGDPTRARKAARQTVAGGAPIVGDCLRTEAGFTAGVPADPVCPDPTCPGAATCATVIVVPTGGDLQMAAAGAIAGDCLALEPGAHGAVDLPAGVSLLGRSAADVTVGEIGDGIRQTQPDPPLHVPAYCR